MLNLSQPGSLGMPSREYTSQPLPALSASPEQLLCAAFNLAFFIHPDEETALRIASDALAGLDMALSAQDKRLYYSPVGQFFSRQHSSLKLRNRVSVNELHLLQRLVLLEAESHEKSHEMSRAGAVQRDDLLIRFIKHLVRITIKRNSFYVALGLSRLLHSYSTAETANIYSLIIQDPTRVKDDSYFRSCKRQLMRELKLRFGAFMKVTRVARGEERFESEPVPGSQAALVRRCLYMFTPWKTGCVIPQNFDASNDELAELRFEGDDPDKEHPIEVSRMHSIIDPDCYERISTALGLESPEERMALPSFQTSDDEEDGPGGRADRTRPPELTRRQIDGALSELAEKKARRKRLSAKRLLVVVDGITCASFDPATTTGVRLDVDEYAEVVEVRARDDLGEVRIGLALLDHYEQTDATRRFRMELEGGQKLCLGVTMRRDSGGEVQGATLDLDYRQKPSAEARPRLQVVTGANKYLRKLIDSVDSSGPGALKQGFAMSVDHASDARPRNPSRQVAEILTRGVLHAAELKASHVRLTGRLIKAAQPAIVWRNQELLNDLSRLLLAIPLNEARSAGQLYAAIHARREGRSEEARRRFESLIEDRGAHAYFRAGAMQSLALLYHGRKDLGKMMQLYEEGFRFTRQQERPDYHHLAHMVIGISAAYSYMGEAKRALNLVTQVEPIIEMAGRADPTIMLMHLNNKAEFMIRAGKPEEGVRFIRAAFRSPFLQAYLPIIEDTARQIEEQTGKHPLSL